MVDAGYSYGCLPPQSKVTASASVGRRPFEADETPASPDE